MQNVELLSVKIAPVNLLLNNNTPKKISTASFELFPFLKNWKQEKIEVFS